MGNRSPWPAEAGGWIGVIVVWENTLVVNANTAITAEMKDFFITIQLDYC